MSSGPSPRGTIPSKVTDDYWVYINKSGREANLVDPDFVGKWMVFGSTQNPDSDGLTQLDHFWLKIEEHFQQTELHGAKVSTAKPNPNSSTSKAGVICCYTRDFRDKPEVKRNADKIRAILGPSYVSPMYYKSDEATSAGKYTWSQNSGVSIYRNLPDGSFWERDSKNKWQLVD